MLFLSVSLLFFNLFAITPEQKIKNHFQNYVKQAANGSVDKSLYSENFAPTVKDDKVIYKVCAKNNCRIKMNIKKMPHKSGLWKLRAQIFYGPKTQPQFLNMRRGCYFIYHHKISNYIEDCDDR